MNKEFSVTLRGIFLYDKGQTTIYIPDYQCFKSSNTAFCGVAKTILCSSNTMKYGVARNA